MKPFIITACIALSVASSNGSELKKAFQKQNSGSSETREQALKNHADSANEVSVEQDELSADVQELIQEETNGKVIKLLSEAELLMVQTTDELSNANTSGSTIAMPTEIIEKIAAAAKEKVKKPGEGNPSDPLLQMMQQMMGKSPGEGQPKKGEGEGSKAGEGKNADSDTLNQFQTGDSKGRTEARRLPKNSGKSGSTLPLEFHKALDAYNKAQDTSK